MTRQAARKIRISGVILFLIYLFLVAYLLFFSERYGRVPGKGEIRYNLEPMREIRRFWQYRRELGPTAVFTNLAGNVILLIPFGGILPVLFRRLRSLPAILACSFLFSLTVETAQLVTRLGSFDVDDLILNTLGGFIGYGIFVVCNHYRRKLYG